METPDPPVTRMKMTTCPACDGALNAATESKGRPVMPQPGDFTICMHCGHALVFTQDFSLAAVDDADLPREVRLHFESFRQFMKRRDGELQLPDIETVSKARLRVRRTARLKPPQADGDDL